MRPALAVMDGTVGLEGNGPKSGRPRVVDRVLCSSDPVALDTIQAIMMGIDPATVVHLAKCAARGIGTNQRDRIEVRGLEPEKNRRGFPAGEAQRRLHGGDAAASVGAQEAVLQHADLQRVPGGRQALLPRVDQVAGQGALARGAGASSLRSSVDAGLEGSGAASAPAESAVGAGKNG